MTDEERALWDVYVQTGRPVDYRNRLIENYYDWAMGICAKVYKRHAVNLEDAKSEGALGLIDAVEKFNPSYKRFEPYAGKTIVRRILDLRRHGFYRRRGRERAARGEIELKSFISLSDSSQCDRVYHTETPRLDWEDWIEVACVGLSQLQRRIVVSVYRDGKSLADVARESGYSEPHISQMHRKALDILKLKPMFGCGKGRVAPRRGTGVGSAGRGVECVDTGEVFSSGRKASLLRGFAEDSVSKAIRFGVPLGGQVWRLVN